MVRYSRTSSASLLLDGHPPDKVEMFKYRGVLCHMTSPGVNMFSLRVPRLKRFSDSSKSNSITIHPVMQCFSCIFL